MRVLAGENFPRPALEALREAGWDVFSIAEQCPGVPDEEVAALCAEQQKILLTFDKDFGELIFRRGLPAGSGVVLFRITPESPEEAADVALALAESAGSSWVFLRSHTGPNSHTATQPGFRRLTRANIKPEFDRFQNGRGCQQYFHAGRRSGGVTAYSTDKGFDMRFEASRISKLTILPVAS